MSDTVPNGSNRTPLEWHNCANLKDLSTAPEGRLLRYTTSTSV